MNALFLGTLVQILLYVLIVFIIGYLTIPFRCYTRRYFDRKVVWITGASSGIGEALAIELARQCPTVSIILSARREEELNKVAKQLNIPRKQCLVVPLDLELFNDDFHRKIQLVCAKFGRIDVVINNGGISQRSLIKDTDVTVDRRLIDVNLLGTIVFSKNVLPVFIKQNSGHYVVVTSAAAYAGGSMRSTYAAAKSGLHAFFESLRVEHQTDNIDVTMVVPGFVRTNISKNAFSGSGKLHGVMDPKTNDGTDRFVCAREILNGVAVKNYEIYVGRKSAIVVYLRRFCPWLLHQILLRTKST